jgi:hypothetical protein
MANDNKVKVIREFELPNAHLKVTEGAIGTVLYETEDFIRLVCFGSSNFVVRLPRESELVVPVNGIQQ